MPVVRRQARNTSRLKTRAALLPAASDEHEQQQNPETEINHPLIQQQQENSSSFLSSSPPLFTTTATTTATMSSSSQVQHTRVTRDNDDDGDVQGEQQQHHHHEPQSQHQQQQQQQRDAADDHILIAISIASGSSLGGNLIHVGHRRSVGVAWANPLSAAPICVTEFTLPHFQHTCNRNNGSMLLSLPAQLSDAAASDTTLNNQPHHALPSPSPDPLLRRALISLVCSILSRDDTAKKSNNGGNGGGGGGGGGTETNIPISIRWIVNSNSGSSGSGGGGGASSSSQLLADVINSMTHEVLEVVETSDRRLSSSSASSLLHAAPTDSSDEDENDGDKHFRQDERTAATTAQTMSFQLSRNNITFLSNREFNSADLTVSRLLAITTISAQPQDDHQNNPEQQRQQHQKQKQKEEHLALLLSPATTTVTARNALAAFTRYVERQLQQQQQQQHPSSPRSALLLCSRFATVIYCSPPPSCIAHLFVPASTYVALQLSWLEPHPTAGAHRLGRSKEGFSLLSVLGGACATGLGRSALRAWFASPSSDAQLLRQRHDAVAFLVEPRNREVFEALAVGVARFRDPLPMLHRIASGQHTTLKDWQRLVGSCNAAVQICELSKMLLMATMPSTSMPAASAAANPNSSNKPAPDRNNINIVNYPGAASFTMLHRIRSVVDVDAVQEMERLIQHVIDFSQLATSASAASSSSARRRNQNNNNNNHPTHQNNHNIFFFQQQQQHLQNTVRVRPGVDAGLDEMRQSQIDMEAFLVLFARQQFEKELLPHARRNNNSIINNNNSSGGGAEYNNSGKEHPLTVVNLPQVGFLLCLPVASIAAGGGFAAVVPPSWELCLNTSEHVYFKNAAMGQLDEQIGDVHASTQRREAEVRRQLDERVLHMAVRCGFLLPSSSSFSLSSEKNSGNNQVATATTTVMISTTTVTTVIAELDCLLALASKAQQENWVRPKMVLDEPGFVSLRGCWHPLLSHHRVAADCAPVPCPQIELSPPAAFAHAETAAAAEAATSASLFSSTPPPPRLFSHRSIVISGPNGSGKSVLTRTVAVCVFLACIGSFVPAESAVVGMFDAILTNDTLPSSSAAAANGSGVAANNSRNNRNTGDDDAGSGRRKKKINNNSSSTRAAAAAATTGQDSNSHGEGQQQFDATISDPSSVPPVLRSSFGEELTQVGAALSIATGATLLVLDEFGSGTLAEDGIALLGGVLAYCSKLPPSRRPSLLVTTHFTELLSSLPSSLLSSASSSSPLRNNQCLWLTMSTTSSSSTAAFSNRNNNSSNNNNNGPAARDDDDNDDDDVFLFVPKAGSLHAAARCTVKIAKRCGLPPSVVKDIATELGVAVQ